MDLFEQFLEFEKEHKLFDLQYKGVPYWHFIRFNIFEIILYGENASEGHPDMFSKTVVDKLGFIPFILNEVKHYFDKKEYDLFVSYVYATKDVSGKMINPFTWFIADNHEFKTKMNTIFSGNWVKEPPNISNNALIEALWLPFFVYSKAIQKIGLKDDADLKRIINLLNTQFSCNLSYTKWLNYVQQFVLKFKLLRWYYMRVIKGKYRAIIFGCHYSLYNYALVSVARECDIPTFELQHGIINGEHISYNFIEPDSTNMYLPKYIFMFGDYCTKTARLPDGTTAIAVGFPLMDYTLKLYSDVTRDPKTVVFYSDGIIGPMLSKLAIRFSELAVPLGYRIIYKFHPTERLTWRDRYPWLVIAPNIEFEDRAINVHEILASAKHHIGVASTVLLEALAFKGFVYIWEIEERVPYLDVAIQEGFSQLFQTEHQLLSQVTSSSGKKSDKDIEKFSQQFYKPNAEKNIFNALQEIINMK